MKHLEVISQLLKPDEYRRFKKLEKKPKKNKRRKFGLICIFKKRKGDAND